MADRKAVEMLIAHAREQPNWEAAKAKAIFQKFMSGQFSYDEISNHPDYPVYASAQVLATILPLIIDEMFSRKDLGNFLIYHVITAVDPFGGGKPSYAERTAELVNLVDEKTANKIYKVLTAIKTDPPIPLERLDRIIAFWRNKVASSPL